MQNVVDLQKQEATRDFQKGLGGLNARATAAGAFGGSRMRDEQTDLERARLDSLAGASANQYNHAYEQLQGGIANLLGFGGLERELDIQQRQALPASIRFGSDVLSKLLNASTSQGTSSGSSKGSSYTGAFAG
jgi:hypothetical protein